MNILLLSYNNYYNRIYRKHNTILEYVAASSAYIVLTDYNFDPADGVITTAVFGKGTGAFLN